MFLPLLAFAALPSPGLLAQNFKTLHSFDGSGGGGGGPESGVTLIGNTLYGTTHSGNGGSYSQGAVFSLSTDGTGFKVLFSFPLSDLGVQTGYPEGKFVIADGVMYGTGYDPMWATPPYPWYGFMFSVGIDGTSQSFNNWYEFEPVFGDGSQPDGVIQSGDFFYGVTHYGGQFLRGTVYAWDGGSLVTNLHSFAGSDGANPYGGLILSTNGSFYGVTRSGGGWGNGTVYALDLVSAELKTLHHFAGSTNSEGANPLAGLILSGNTLFGTTFAGGTSNSGTVFRIGIDGTGFTTLHSFSGGSDGANPYAPLTLSGNTLYGTTSQGGTAGSGTVFSVTIEGAFSTLHSFSGFDGAVPMGELAVSGDTLFGTTKSGGSGLSGTVFSLLIQPQLTITPSGQNVVLTWPASTTSFYLQSATGFSPLVWTNVYPGPDVIDGLNTLTYPIISAQQFYRLSR